MVFFYSEMQKRLEEREGKGVERNVSNIFLYKFLSFKTDLIDGNSPTGMNSESKYN
jgi:hypothetical protein